ncbi:MAG: protocatechuate 3,4-dioxygenase beta subunit [Bradymonadia bacterium]|jgi:protocatechuate 3,4-dioxygenase beta subunit
MHRRRFLTRTVAVSSGVLLGSTVATRSLMAQSDDMLGELACSLTTRDAQGPFFLSGAPTRAALGPEGSNPTIHLRGLIVGQDCQAKASGYRIDVWHADAAGAYQMEGSDAYLYRGLLETDADGRFEIMTVRPGNYSIGRDYMRPAHYHFKVYAPDGTEAVTTQFYFDDDAYLGESDGCQPRSCDSYDEERYMHLVTGDGSMQTADLRIVV